nr:phage exclusion protein Lit family protein [Chitinophaga sp. S165]
MQETFLSYLWYNCYSFLTIVLLRIENALSPTKSMSLNELFLFSEAEATWAYGFSLIDKYSDWKLDMPNPEYIKSGYENLIERTNLAYLSTVNFILAHEFAHQELSHCLAIDSDHLKSIEQEKEADLRAFEIIMAGEKNGDVNNIKLGAMIGVWCLAMVVILHNEF